MTCKSSNATYKLLEGYNKFNMIPSPERVYKYHETDEYRLYIGLSTIIDRGE